MTVIARCPIWPYPGFEPFDGPTELLRILSACPDCGEPILVADNGPWLDARNIARGELILAAADNGPVDMMVGSLFKLGTRIWAGFGSPGPFDGGSRHRLHTHQPDEARAMARVLPRTTDHPQET